MKREILIATGHLDTEGDSLVLDGVKPRDKHVKIFEDFNHSKLIGLGERLEVRGDELWMEATFKDGYDPVGKFPAMGFDILKYHTEGDVRVIDEWKLWCVGLGGSNVDPNVPCIKITPASN